jgi:hypothetical protein
MEDEEKRAYLFGGQNGGEYLDSIRKTNLAELSEDEWLTFLECICKNYHSKYVELTTNAAFKF